MARQPRHAPSGLIYHVLNRAVAQYPFLRTEKDHLAFEAVVAEAAARVPGIRLLAWCAMSTHWHFVVHPRADGELAAFFRWLTLTHVMRWRVAHRTVGFGPLYQGRFKSFPLQDRHGLEVVCRYVERNALSAGLVKRAEDWRWGSLHARLAGQGDARHALLAPWPVPMPDDWVAYVNATITAREQDRVRECIRRGAPLGEPAWTARIVDRLQLGHTQRREGRPKAPDDKN